MNLRVSPARGLLPECRAPPQAGLFEETHLSKNLRPKAQPHGVGRPVGGNWPEEELREGSIQFPTFKSVRLRNPLQRKL
jgi:hypothetical protein